MNVKNGLSEVVLNRVNPYNQILTLNKDFYNNKSKLIKTYKDNVNSGFYMLCGLSDDELQIMNINHEYGHILQNTLLVKRYKSLGWTSKDARKFIDESKINRLQWYDDVLADFEKECVDEIVTIAEKNNPNFDLLKSISKYGLDSDSDFFAEVFANSQSSKPNELGLAMEQWLKEKGY